MKTISERLNEIAKTDTSWIDDFTFDTLNERWLKHSAKISVKILVYLREHNLHKYDMVDLLGVSAECCDKMLKGGYNFDLNIITKIEEKFDIKLIEIL